MRITKIIFLLATIFFIFLTERASSQNNNSCNNAFIINTQSKCVSNESMLTNQTLTGATADGYTINLGSGIQANYRDVWYKFVAKTKNPTISVSNFGSGWFTLPNIGIQLLSGTCGNFTQIASTAEGMLTPTSLLVQGNTYYIKIHGYTATTIPANCTFNICVTEDLTKASRMNEVFSRTVLSSPGDIQYPWEIAYGHDDSLWVNEARAYKLYKMSPITGVKRLVLDLSSNSTWLGNSGTGADTLYAQNMSSWSPWPQGGFAGFALHPNFGDGTGKDYVYVSYVWKFLSDIRPNGIFYRNKLVRFTYNNSTKRLDNPAVLDWNLPGTNDHNSQRIIVAPVTPGGTNYLFMASGDMGSGQFDNRYRTNNAQNIASYEGKILRFNLDSTGQQGSDYQKWIPYDNPYGAKSAVWSIGIRNNQGFAYDALTNRLYGSSHGPYSDDEINIIEGFKNYGHPLIIGYADGNYNGNAATGTFTSISAGAPFTECDYDGNTPPLAYTQPYCGKSSIAPVGNEVTNKNIINANAAVSGAYVDPVFSAYPSTQPRITSVWQNNPSNAGWESEAWSGLDIYNHKLIPGWKRSLLVGGLKWGRVIKLNLDETGTKTLPSGIGSQIGNAGDTVTYFQSINRYRDLAFAPNGKDIFLVMDNSSATSGPGTNNPTAPACPGCVVKYSFLGYADASGLSTIPKTISVTSGAYNTCNSGTPVTIDSSNNFLWVPITGPDGNILAEINAMGQNIGLITSSFYQNALPIRTANGVKYLDRNITISPTVATDTTKFVKVRLYISKTEMDELIAADGINNALELKIHTNNDACLAVIGTISKLLNPENTSLANITHGSNGYVMQTTVKSFGSYYFAGNATILPLDLITFSGTLQNGLFTLLKWKTDAEVNVDGFDVERSTNGSTYNKIGFVKAKGYGLTYSLNDNEILNQTSQVVYYRLKIIDNNGEFKYSNSIYVTLPVNKAIITIAPNPTSNNLNGNITSPASGNVTLKIYDITGRIVLETNNFIKKGNNSINQNITKLSSGLYIVEISGNSIFARSKFQKL